MSDDEKRTLRAALYRQFAPYDIYRRDEIMAAFDRAAGLTKGKPGPAPGYKFAPRRCGRCGATDHNRRTCKR